MTQQFRFMRAGIRLLMCAAGVALFNVACAVPVITTNTLPVTAVDVVGSSVKFTASFSSALSISYQWQVIRNGTTNNLAGATSPTLTLANLQTNDAGSYRLRATDSQGVTFSTARTLTVNPAPTPDAGIIAAFAAQTGLGASGTNFFPTWSVTPGSLVAGQTPSSVGAGNFSQWGGGTVAVLTDNSIGQFNYIPNVGGSATEVTCGTSGGQSVTYTLPNAANGYDLTNIVVYGGWGDMGRDQQAYTISCATVSAPGKVYAFEVDAYGNYYCTDDGNIPNLLSLPYLGAVKPNDKVYLNTRKLLLSADNPYWCIGKAATGLGGPHVGVDMIWPLGVVIQTAFSEVSFKFVFLCG